MASSIRRALARRMLRPLARGLRILMLAMAGIGGPAPPPPPLPRPAQTEQHEAARPSSNVRRS